MKITKKMLLQRWASARKNSKTDIGPFKSWIKSNGKEVLEYLGQHNGGSNNLDFTDEALKLLEANL